MLGFKSIIDLLYHSVCIVVLVSNSPLVPASQEAAQDEYKQTKSVLKNNLAHVLGNFVISIKCSVELDYHFILITTRRIYAVISFAISATYAHKHTYYV